MCDEDWGAGGRGVPSSCHSDRDGVVGVRLQPGDGCGSRGAWDRELLGRFTPYIGKNEGTAEFTFRIDIGKRYIEKNVHRLAP